jgi:hypothetical protein
MTQQRLLADTEVTAARAAGQVPAGRPLPVPLPLEERLDRFAEHLRTFTLEGQPSELHHADGLDYVVNEYWTSRQRQAHSIHEVSYRACFKPQLPAFFIRELTDEGDTVHDPFMGRGTTLVESALLGRVPSGNDVNPLSAVLTRPRLSVPDPAELLAGIAALDLSGGTVSDPELEVFFHPATLAEIEALKAQLLARAPLDGAGTDPVDDWIRMVTINRLTGHSSGFLSGRSLPPNQAVSIASQRRINERLGLTPPQRDVRGVLAKKTRTLLRSGVPPQVGASTLLTGRADATSSIPSGSVGLVVTSPPFLDVVDYAGDNWLRCWFAGIDAAAVEISMCRTAEQWTGMVHDVLAEQARILRPGRFIAFEVGEVRNGTVKLELLVRDAARGLPLDVVCVMINAQSFTKTSNIWGVHNDRKGTNTNRIVLLRRT